MRTLALALALAACKRVPSTGCAQKAADVARYLRTVDQGPRIFELAPLAPPVRDDITDRGENAPVVGVGSDSVTYQGARIDGRDDLASKLAATHHNSVADRDRKDVGPDATDPDLFAVVADERAPMASVAMAVDAAEASGFSKAMFVFRRTPAAPPPRSAVDDEIDKIVASRDPVDRASAFAKLASDKIDACPALKKLFGAVSAVGDDKAKIIIDGIEPSLNACACAADPATVQSLVGRILYNSEPAGVLRVTLDRNAPPIHAATWGEASKQLTPATKAVWFN